jgi:tRNA A-37 threonylcarbamoyl transferase component Bud32
VALRIGPRRGLCLAEVGASEAAAALASNRGSILEDDTRSRVRALRVGNRAVVVKEFPRRGIRRMLADALRGSPARRAFRGGHGLLARGIGAPVPLAFVERRRWLLPTSSAVLLEDVRPALPAHRAGGIPDGAVLEALTDLVVRLHRSAVAHGDLTADNVHLMHVGDRIEARVLDLEDVRFPRRLRERRRIRALAALNASLPDRFEAWARRDAFARYCAALPFADTGAALRRIVEIGVARAHRWTARPCQGTVSGGCDDHPAVEARRAGDPSAGAEFVREGAARTRATGDLLEGHDLRLGVLGIETVKHDLHPLLRLEHVQDEGREGEELADPLDGLDREARNLDL